MATKTESTDEKTPAAAAKKQTVVYQLEDPKGREYATADKGEAVNRVHTQGYKLVSPKQFD